MSTEMIAALALGALALLLSLLAILLAALAKSGSGAAARDVAGFRQQATQTQSAEWMREREVQGVFRAHTKALKAIDMLRTELNVALRAEPGRVRSEDVIKAVSDAGRRITTVYDEVHAQLGRTERAAFHHAKEYAHDVLHQTRAALESTPDPSRMNEDSRRLLLRIRDELADLERALRDARVELLAHAMFVEPRAEG